GARIRLIRRDGTSELVDRKPGDVFWSEAAEHSLEVVSGSLHEIETEIKGGVPPPFAPSAKDVTEITPELARVQRLKTAPGVGPITALSWALEIGDVSRFRSVKQAISYCGLCGAEKSSADKVMRTPLSKQRNKHLQRVLVEAAKVAPRESPELA